MQKEENQQLELEESVRTAAVMKSRNSEERAMEVENLKQLDAGRAYHPKAILAKAMHWQKRDFSLCVNNEVQ